MSGGLAGWVPPVMVRWLKAHSPRSLRFTGEYATWEDAAFHSHGYGAKEILQKVLEATLKVKRGEAAFERDSVAFDEIDYAWPVLADLMWVAACRRGRLNVLDFGGALGSSYFQNRRFLRGLAEVRWSVLEQEHYVQAGREHVQDDRIRFYADLNECLSENQPDVILLSSVLQYLPSPYETIAQLAACSADYLIIDRTPFAGGSDDKLFIQHTPASIYRASYPMWVFSEEKFLAALQERWERCESHTGPEGRVRAANGFEFSFQGMCLERRG